MRPILNLIKKGFLERRISFKADKSKPVSIPAGFLENGLGMDFADYIKVFLESSIGWNITYISRSNSDEESWIFEIDRECQTKDCISLDVLASAISKDLLTPSSEEIDQILSMK